MPAAGFARSRVPRARWRTRAVIGVAAVGVTACATLQQVAALRQVDFTLGPITEIRVAGVDVTDVRSTADLSIAEGARLAAAAAAREMPLTLQVQVLARNPPENSVTARLLRMEWMLFLEETETVGGVVDREYALPPGETQIVPIDVSFELFDVFDRTGPDLVELVLNLAGAGGSSKEVMVRAVPTINTVLGPVRYPEPVTIVSGTVGRDIER